MEPNCSLCSQPAAGEFRFKHDDQYHWYCTGCLMARVARQSVAGSVAGISIVDGMGSFHGRSIVGDEEKKRNMLRIAPELMPKMPEKETNDEEEVR